MDIASVVGLLTAVAYAGYLLSLRRSREGSPHRLPTREVAVISLVTAALLAFPDLVADFSEAAAATYATSTLGGLDVAALLDALDRLMREDRIYRDENLSLAAVATLLKISPHQLSELINTQHKVGFPRFVRGFRIDEACRLLREDPKATILSISLDTGFQSQSSFYTAFREITGTSPGQFRSGKSAKPASPDS